MHEKEIENKVCVYARNRDMQAVKYKTPNRRNAPDRLFNCAKGYHFFIEFKAPGKEPSKGQLREHRRLRKLGHHVYVCDDIEAGKRIIDLWVAFLRTAPPVPAPRPEFLT